MKLVLLRPQPGADATAVRARAAGFYPVIAPLFVIEPVEWTVPEQTFDAVMITSANAIRHGGAKLSALVDLPVLAVGTASTDAARQAGFAVAIIGDTDASALLAMAKEAGFRDIIWLAGADHVPVDPDWADQVTIQTVYRAQAIEPAARLIEHLNADAVVALHSPRAARHFAEHCDQAGIDRAAVYLVALSPAVADAAGYGWHNIAVAAAPNDAALLSAVQALFNGDIEKPTG
jgi:uroporphyrinogen-III synthase